MLKRMRDESWETFACSQPLHEWKRKVLRRKQSIKWIESLCKSFMKSNFFSLRSPTKWISYFINCVISSESSPVVKVASEFSRRRRKKFFFSSLLQCFSTATRAAENLNRINLGIWQMSQSFHSLFSYPLKSENRRNFFLVIFPIEVCKFYNSNRFLISSLSDIHSTEASKCANSPTFYSLQTALSGLRSARVHDFWLNSSSLFSARFDRKSIFHNSHSTTERHKII